MTDLVDPQSLLTKEQLDYLLHGIHPGRVKHNDKGFAHVEAWDVRRTLLRVFGFGGYDIQLTTVDLVHQHGEQRRKRTREGHEYGAPYTAWTVIYRATVRLTVKVRGIVLGVWDGSAIGAGQHLPNLADAHDLAIKAAESQALKRAATNMGDQFGLGLYNGGQLDPVVIRSLPHTATVEQPALPADETVLPDPEDEAAQRAAATTAGDAPAAPRPAPPTGPVEPHPQAQAIADAAARQAKTKDDVKGKWWGQGAKAQVLNAPVLAPDTGKPDALGGYLTRLAAALDQPKIPAPAGRQSRALPPAPPQRQETTWAGPTPYSMTDAVGASGAITDTATPPGEDWAGGREAGATGWAEPAHGSHVPQVSEGDLALAAASGYPDVEHAAHEEMTRRVALDRLKTTAALAGMTDDNLAREFHRYHQTPLDDATATQIEEFDAVLNSGS